MCGYHACQQFVIVNVRAGSFGLSVVSEDTFYGTTIDEKWSRLMEPGPNEVVLQQAEFDADAIIKYHWAGIAWFSIFCVTIPITILLAIFYKIFLTRMIASWECVLTSRSLNVKMGVFIKTEKTVPLEKITDLQMVQGPLMRYFNLHRISVETAGQSGPGSLISLLGIKDTEAFRKEVLEQRDCMGKPRDVAAVPAASSSDPVLLEIRDSLVRTEQLLRQLTEQRPNE